MSTLQEVLQFLRNPLYEVYPEMGGEERKRKFLSLLKWNLLCSMGFGFSMYLIFLMLGVVIESPNMDELYSSGPLKLIFLAAIVAPIVEESIFRWPLAYFKDKPYFKWVFYLSVILFGFVHVGNYEFGTIPFLLWPVLISPQLSAGVFLGFIRVKMGIKWSMLLHACYNGILITPFVLISFIETLHP